MNKLFLLFLLIGVTVYGHIKYGWLDSLKPYVAEIAEMVQSDDEYVVVRKGVISGTLNSSQNYRSGNKILATKSQRTSPVYYLVCKGATTGNLVAFSVAQRDHRGTPMNTVIKEARFSGWERLDKVPSQR